MQNKPEYSNCDLIVETVSKKRTHKKLYTVVGIAAVSVVLASIWWKYPDVLNNIQPIVLVRIFKK